jgi:hypothetical protein
VTPTTWTFPMDCGSTCRLTRPLEWSTSAGASARVWRFTTSKLLNPSLAGTGIRGWGEVFIMMVEFLVAASTLVLAYFKFYKRNKILNGRPLDKPAEAFARRRNARLASPTGRV